MEQAFRHFKLSDLEVRPIYHYTEPRVRANLLLCMLAYWVQREMQRALAPLLFVDEAPPARPDPVAPAPRSETVLEKYRTQRTADGFPVHSFRTLLADLGTMVKNRVILTGVPEAPGLRPGDRANPASSSSLGVVTATHQPFVARAIVQSSPFPI